MRKTCILMILSCVLGGSVFAAEVLKSADVGCRAGIYYPTTNRHDSSKLSVRNDADAYKSWIKFDLSTLSLSDPNSVPRGAVLRLTNHETGRGGTFDVSAVNDDCLDNIDWAEREITWNNAPANNLTSWTDVDTAKATYMGTIDFGTNEVAQAGDQFFVDVSAVVLADTDKIVQFVLHNSSGLLQVATADHPSGEEYWPTLILTYPPAGADYPNPEVGEVVTTDLTSLSWTNPDPNAPGGSIIPTVYLGTEPNRIGDMTSVTLGANVESVAISSFPAPYNSLQNNTIYYWYVDCDDAGNLIPGEEWSFETYNNEAPYNVDAGADQWIALDSATSVNLSGSADDDGLPVVPGSLSYEWAETAGPGTSVIATDTASSTSVSFTERGDYTFTLTVDDGELQTTDEVRIVVGDDDCDASHILSGDPYNVADSNMDCVVDLLDLVDLITTDWLNCTDTLTNCGL